MAVDGLVRRAGSRLTVTCTDGEQKRRWSGANDGDDGGGGRVSHRIEWWEKLSMAWGGGGAGSKPGAKGFAA